MKVIFSVPGHDKEPVYLLHPMLLFIIPSAKTTILSKTIFLTSDGAQNLFPFKAYFEDAPGGLFRGEGYAADMERARGAFRHLKNMFQELEEGRAFELLKVALLGSHIASICCCTIMPSDQRVLVCEPSPRCEMPYAAASWHTERTLTCLQHAICP